MAKIALICHSLHPQVLNLANQLSTHKNEVLLMTSRDQLTSQADADPLPENFNFQIIRPFQKWSAMEAIRLFTHLLVNMPDGSFCLIQLESNTYNRTLCPESTLQPIPGRVVASSFFHSPTS